MKSLLIICLLITSGIAANSQTSHNLVAENIANRMRDSLSLTNEQRDSIRSTNLQLATWKALKRETGLLGEELRIELQAIENLRDSLYRPFLNLAQYEQYLNKKKVLIKAD